MQRAFKELWTYLLRHAAELGYAQGENNLCVLEPDSETAPTANTCFCCLGVAADMVANHPKQLDPDKLPPEQQANLAKVKAALHAAVPEGFDWFDNRSTKMAHFGTAGLTNSHPLWWIEEFAGLDLVEIDNVLGQTFSILNDGGNLNDGYDLLAHEAWFKTQFPERVLTSPPMDIQVRPFSFSEIATVIEYFCEMGLIKLTD